jgi:hypothetical protein
LLRSAEDDVVPVNTDGYPLSRDEVPKSKVIDQAKDREGEEIAHELATALDRLYVLTLESETRPLDGQIKNRVWNSRRNRPETVNDCPINLNRKVVGRRFIVPGDVDLAILSEKISERGGACVTAK